MAKILGPVTIEFDATTLETHSGSTSPTEHPVEDGALVADHAIDQPDEVELVGMVTNTPILALASQRARSVLGGPASARAVDAYEEIRRLRRTKTLVEVETELRTYSSMLIISDSVTRDKDTKNILQITVRFREFRTATVETTEAPQPTSDIDGPEPDLGRKQTAPAPAEVSEKAGTLATDLAGFVGDLPSGFLVGG
jgi:hypothetical protein